jgi:hypothetical protein
MLRQIGQTVSLSRVLAFLVMSVVLGTTEWSYAQSDASQQHIMLPPAIGGTALSHQIHAEASYVAAYGDMVESVAIARKINAEAVALEIQNSVEYVDAYFKRRELNRQWRAKEDPNYLDRETRRQKVLKQRVEAQYQDLLRGDVTGPLNWLLRELSGPVVSYRYLPTDQTLVHSSLDPKLSDRDLHQIQLNDGGGKTSQLVFTAADGKAFSTPWPLGLREPVCAPARGNYEHSRDAVVEEMTKKGQASYENQVRLMQDTNALFVALEKAFPQERRKDPHEFLTYGAAKRFLQATLAASHRAITTTDTRAMTGSLRFQGDSIVGLLDHMYQNGLEFAPPAPGGEGVYKSLFQSMRSLYMTIGPDKPAAEVLHKVSGNTTSDTPSK